MPPDQCVVSNLSIYPEKILVKDVKIENSNEQIVGASAMAFMSGLKTKYKDTVTAIKDFQKYSRSTEGKIKFSVMFAGLLGGCVLAYKSPSKRLWYKRILPAGTFSLAASVCYPYKALEVAKSTSYGIAATYGASKIVVTYCYRKLKKIKNHMNDADVVKVVEANEELEYTVNNNGILEMKQNAERETSQQQPKKNDIAEDASREQSNNNESDTNLKTTNVPFSDALKTVSENNKAVLFASATPAPDLYNVLSVPKIITESAQIKEFVGDEGQGSPEDADLYTTR